MYGNTVHDNNNNNNNNNNEPITEIERTNQNARNVISKVENLTINNYSTRPH